MNRRIKLTGIIGILFLVATIAIYAIARPEYYVSTGLGFGFLLYGEIVFFAGILLIEYWALNASQIITRVGAGIPIQGYALIVIVASLIYMNSHSILVKGFLILQIVLFVLAFTVTVLMLNFAKTRKINDNRVLQADAMAKDFENQLRMIRENCDCKDAIDKLIEGIKYSDTSTMVDADVELSDAIAELEREVKADEQNDSAINLLIEKIEFLIKKRKLQTKSAKQGGI